jgi:disulfide oxidoreductase YuzD
MLTQGKFLLGVICVLLFAGCAKKPDTQEVQQYLSSQLGRDPFYAISALQIEVAKAQDDKQRVTFKAELKSNELLYRLVDVEALIRKGGWDDGDYIKAIAMIANLPDDEAKKLVDGATFATQSPTLVEQMAKPGETRAWYGSVDATYVVDKWSFANLATQDRQEFNGEPRSKFGTKSYVLDTPEATEALDSLKKARAAFAENVKAKVQLVAERKGREEAELRAQELTLSSPYGPRFSGVGRYSLLPTVPIHH